MRLPKSVEGYRLGLASASPRRRELMEMLAVPFDLIPPLDVDETYPAGLPAAEVPVYLSRLKADAYRVTMRHDDLFVTADTVVIIDGEVLGKPRSLEEAKVMLQRLSGRTHDVVTGVTLFTRRVAESFSALTHVEFSALSQEEIDDYVDTSRPLDKAGAYGIQEWIGAVGIRSIDGSFYNVMGLPVHLLWEALVSFPGR